MNEKDIVLYLSGWLRGKKKNDAVNYGIGIGENKEKIGGENNALLRISYGREFGITENL